MILVWNDAKSFNRHLENMRVFQQSHQANATCGWKFLKDMPMPYDFQPRNNGGGVNRFFNSSGRTIFVPIWKITPSGNLLN